MAGLRISNSLSLEELREESSTNVVPGVGIEPTANAL